MADPRDIGGEELVERLSLDVPLSDLDLLERFAAYRNSLAAVSGKKLKRRWSRKSLAESLLAVQMDSLRHQLAEMFAALGPLPASDDKDAMQKYARRVLAWDKKHNGDK